MTWTDISLPDPVSLAIPAFILLILFEAALGLRHGSLADYELRDTAASLLMGLGNFASGFVTAALFLGAADWVYQYRLFDIGYGWWAFAAVFVLEDLCYYWFHRLSHEHRFWWAAHVNHHSSQHYNLSTALRQTWTGNLAGTWAVWLPLSLLGFPTPLIVFQKGISLVYQFWIHTEAVGKMWRPIELIFNTPSHHRVHHATNAPYLDRNYAGILIVWDRLFGTFVEEDAREPCRYGLVHQIASFNPLRIALHEWRDLIRDVARSPSARAAFMYAFGPPGWSHDGSRETSAHIRAAAQSESAGD